MFPEMMTMMMSLVCFSSYFPFVCIVSLFLTDLFEEVIRSFMKETDFSPGFLGTWMKKKPGEPLVLRTLVLTSYL
jgi:hypothetical protein